MRPLWEVSREDAREYCVSLSLEPREDASNMSLAYQRNRVRLELLPAMRKLNPRVDDALLRLASAAAQDDDYIATTAHETFARIAECSCDRVRVESSGFLEASAAVQTRSSSSPSHICPAARETCPRSTFSPSATSLRPCGTAD